MASDQMVYWLALWTSTQMIGVQIPLSPQTFFFFFLKVLFIKKTQNSTQKLFVQCHFFKHFQYASITKDNKMESKVLGNLLLITIIFWTVWPSESESTIKRIPLSDFSAWISQKCIFNHKILLVYYKSGYCAKTFSE